MIKTKIKNSVNRILNRLDLELIKKSQAPFYLEPKYHHEVDFWKTCLNRFHLWYDGELETLFGEKPPMGSQKITAFNHEYNVLLTWLKINQSPKYLEDLQLNETSFQGMKILDVGSGPFPSAQIFIDCKIFCFDPLIPVYIEAGYPIHIYDSRVKFVFGFSEKMPFEEDSFDAIISVNALDHVDDFEASVAEIKRVLKPGGKMRFHLHYHKETKTEPVELNDERVAKAFSWEKNFKKIHNSTSKRGTFLEEGEEYALWSNF